MANSITQEIKLDAVFYLNDFKIDTHRGEIHHQQIIHSIEPKVMNVLLYLCQNLDEVISAELLFEKVWPHSIYSPSSVRRSIALLRAALNDENKTIIVTHPKRGYSLKATVTPIKKLKKSLFSTQMLAFKYPIVGLLILLVFIVFLSNDTLVEANVPISIKEIKPLTSTEENEHFARYSPDGKYLAFIRTSKNDDKQTHIWLKHLTTLQEHKISQLPSYYIYLAWSSIADQQPTLIAAVKEPSGIRFEQILLDNNLHYQSHSTEFIKKSAQWISPFFVDDNKVIYFLSFENNQSALYSYHLGNAVLTKLLVQTAEFKPYKIALSRNKQHLAILGFTQQHLSQIKLFSFDDHSTSLLKTLDANWYFIDWLPHGQSLLLSDGKGLKQLMLSTDSQSKKMTANTLHSLSFENFDFLRYPHVAPDGKSITFNREKIDQDIWLTPLQGDTKKILLVNSNTADWGAKFSPDHHQFAFISMRNGHSQLFVYDLATKLVSLVYANNQQDLAIAPPIWSADGAELISAANDQVFIIQLTELNKTNHMPKVIVLPDVIGQPIQSYHHQNTLLMLSKRDKENAWVKVDLDTLITTHLLWAGEKKALLNFSDQLLLIDGDQLLDANQNVLSKVSGPIKQYFVKTDGIYLVINENENNYLVKVAYNALTDQELVKILPVQAYKDEYIWDVSKDFILTGSTLIEKDLIQLGVAVQ